MKNKYPDDLCEIGPIPKGTIFRDWHDEGVRIIILRGPFHPCVYLGVPLDHPIANKSYNDLPIECHGGLTYSSRGDGDHRSKSRFWYGYDYGHCDDFMFTNPQGTSFGQKKWTLKEIVEDSWTPIYQMKKLMRLAECIARESSSPLRCKLETGEIFEP